jgi:hypothetical protein
MNVGMLWFDNDSRRGVEEKVRRAADHYKNKYGRKPNICFVHSSMLEGNGKQKTLNSNGIEIRSGRSVLPHHLWIGVAEEGEPGS